MNFKLMSLNIKQFCPGLSVPVIKQRINVRYKQILEQEDWVFLNDSEVVTLAALVGNSSTESCTVTFGSTTVTGSGTAWASGMVGKMFRVGDDAQFYRVGAYVSGTEITLEKSYAQDSASGEDFEYWDEAYSPSGSDISKITGITYQSKLVEKSRDYLQRLDPERTSTGSPVYYSVVDRASQGGVTSFDIWPVPDENYGVRVSYKKTVEMLSAGTDEPVFDSALLESASLWDCYRLSFGLTQNPAFMGLARDAMVEYQRVLRETIIQDLESSSLPGKVLDVSGYDSVLYSNEFILDRGVG
jgi:hypothetical protein